MTDNVKGSRGEMPFLDHLEELRWRILWSLLAIIIGTVVGWLVLDRIDVVEILKRPIAPYLPGGRLVFTSPAEPFMLTLKVAFALGCLLASPIVIYQIWAFLSPALYEREKRLIIPALAVGVMLFLAGAVACYQWLLPAALKVLLGFQRTELVPMITIDRYFSMAIPFVVGCGLVAELPLVVTILAALGIVTPQFLGRQRRYAVVIAAFLAALLTPPDAVSMIMMLVPLLLLYEISIWCAWIASRRRARRVAAAMFVLLLLGAGSLTAQNPPPAPPPRPPPPPTPVVGGATPVPSDSQARGRMDTSTARRLGLPTGPTRSFPATDRILDSLLKLPGYRITRYVAETLVVQGDSQTIFLRRESFVEREGTQVEADSIRYHEASCQLDASGDPKLFDQGTVLVGEGMRYDTCLRRGTVRDALTDFQQGGVTWYVRGNLALDSGSTRVYAKDASFTSDPQPVPDYHFAAGQVKWIGKRIMVARPAVLYVRDVPIVWLPFIFQDIRGGRRSGIIVPRFGLNDLVRPTRRYSRHITDLGYYFAINDYLDLLISGDWNSGRSVSLQGASSYRWLNRFMSGGVSYSRTTQLGGGGTANGITWYHNQIFDSRTSFSTNIAYSTRPSIVSRNSLDPFQVVATMHSSGSFRKRFGWGSLDVGGSRSQDLSNESVNQTLPDIRLTPQAVNITPAITWSPGFSFTNSQNFRHRGASLLVPSLPGDSTPLDTLNFFTDDRRTAMSIQTPIRIGRWNWGNSISVNDVVSNDRREFPIPDSTVPGGVRRVLFARTFHTDVDWQTSINLPTLLASTWKVQPGIAILNTTGAGPFMIRNQFSGGEFVRQGKRLAFTAGASPTFFGFLPGFGPLQRIRHSVSPLFSYQYAPGAKVPPEYARALDPTGRTLNASSDPQQTISIGLSQNFEAKLKPPRPAAGDTTQANQEPRKIRLLSINTSAIGYNFEQAKQQDRTGWQSQTLNNTFASDLLPGFSLSISHDLWNGQVGTDSARFDPFLQSVSSSFSIGPGFLRSFAGLFGLRGRASPAPTPPSMPLDTGQTALDARADALRRMTGANQNPLGGYGAGRATGGGSFMMNMNFSSSRTRGATASQFRQGGRQTLTMNMSFSPTRNWRANWSTAYDFDTQQFSQHFVNFQRDLRRWRASFQFAKSANGNFSFSFNIALVDQPDIKFDYDQRTFVSP